MSRNVAIILAAVIVAASVIAGALLLRPSEERICTLGDPYGLRSQHLAENPPESSFDQRVPCKDRSELRRR